jgi:hypothetical protein
MVCRKKRALLFHLMSPGDRILNYYFRFNKLSPECFLNYLVFLLSQALNELMVVAIRWILDFTIRI